MKIAGFITAFLPTGQNNAYFSLDKVGKRFYCYRSLDLIDKKTGIKSRHLVNSLKKLQRSQQRDKLERYKKKLLHEHIHSSTSVFVLGTGACGLGRSVLLRTGAKRYLFNCGEGVQKSLTEVARSYIGPIDNIFITYNTWSNVGGIMGFVLTHRGDLIHADSINMHGPPNVGKVYENAKMFSDSFVDHMATLKWESIDKGKYEDDKVTVEYVDILSNVACEREVGNDCHHEEGSQSGISEPEEMMTGKPHGMQKPLMAYIIRVKQPSHKKIDPEKLSGLIAESGVRVVKKLMKDEHVTLPDGRILNQEDALFENPGLPRPVAVIDCPTEDYIDSLINNKQIMNLSAEGSEIPEMIVHMAPASIIEDQRYKDFIDRFDLETTHLMLNEKSPGPYATHVLPFALNYLHKGIFPLLQRGIDYNTKPKPQTGRIVQGCYSLEYQLRPAKGFNWENILCFDQSTYLDSMKKRGDKAYFKLIKKFTSEKVNVELSLRENRIYSELEKVASQIHARGGDKDVSDEYPEITFLGTGSAKPSIERNASGILVQMRKDEYLMMDCGEGTLLQMYLMYGQEKTYNILSKLKGIFISHIHYDHHGGLIGLLVARSEAFSEKGESRLPIFAPIPVKKWYDMYFRWEAPAKLNIQFVPNHSLYEAAKTARDFNYLSMAKNGLNLSEFIVMPVVHTNNSFGLSIRHQDGWKLVYSGDTMPCKNLVKYGKDCDILIHEGTFDDQSLRNATLNKHCTTSQAIDVGRQMNAKFIILTHFTQRFKRIPEFTENFTENVGFSFDFMQIRPSQLWVIPLLKPVLNLLFGAELHLRLKRRKDKTVEHNIVVKHALADKNLADGMFEVKKRKDEKLWTEAGAQLKAKLQSIERKTNVDTFNEEITCTERDIGYKPDFIDKESESIGNEPAEINVQRSNKNSNKRKV